MNEQIMAEGWERAKRLLSYSETKALAALLPQLKGKTDGVVIASAVSTASVLSRSVIVNALRILEAAGLIKARSMGMKGAHITILFRGLVVEVENAA